ncbi:hypothetical protein IFT72_10835 [Frigoribacterium sp. CFBP 8754]|uniref:hypothetical protein n=1 Tax=Frigoribacterium sp. CFBP 8754 TaxID=2775290 RepID=UPI00177D4616|nr:hypothetical protein [Frigoribacterium sp. CFBP 8754]MBD8660680.1 hypothetical protein [Frigoribacterium sp. CFBP 8754]
MHITVLSVSLALVIGIVVPIVVAALVRRGDAARGKTFPVPDAVTGVLFEVRTRRWQRVLLRVIGYVMAIVGAFMTFIGAVVGFTDPDEALPFGFWIAAVLILAFGVWLVMMASALGRTRLQVWEDRLLARRGFRAERLVLLSDIARLTPYASQYGGIVAKGADGGKLFISDGLELNHDLLADHLRTRLPQVWAASFPGDARGAQR